MKLYTKSQGLVLEGHTKLIKELTEDRKSGYGNYKAAKSNEYEKLLTEKEYLKYKESNLVYEKLDLNYSKIKKIKFELLYQYRYNGVTLSIVTVMRNNKTNFVDHDIEIDNNCLITDLVQAVSSYQGGSSNNIKWLKHLAPYFDLNSIEKYKIELFDENNSHIFKVYEDYTLITGEGSDS